MQKLLGMLWPSAAMGWAGSLLAFIATTVMALDGWDTNFGASFALLVAMFFAFIAQLLTFGAVMAWVIWRMRDQVTEPHVPLRNLLWGATTVMVLASVMVLATGFEFDSPGVIYLLSSAAVSGITAAAISVDDRQRSRHRAAG